MKNNMKTYIMTAIRSTLSSKDPTAAYAHLLLAGSDDDSLNDLTLIGGVGFNLSSTADYQQMRAVTKMSECRISFEQLAELDATFKVIARPSKEGSDSTGMFQLVEPLAVGINNTFIVLRGTDTSIKTEAEALATLKSLEKHGRL